MNEAVIKPRNASALRKVFNIVAIVLNVFHFVSAFFIFGMIFCLIFLGAVIIALFKTGGGEDLILPFILSIVYMMPAIILIITSIVSTVKCFKYGYKKVLEMTSYIGGILYNAFDIIVIILNFKFWAEYGVLSIICSVISIILFTIGMGACLTDK